MSALHAIREIIDVTEEETGGKVVHIKMGTFLAEQLRQQVMTGMVPPDKYFHPAVLEPNFITSIDGVALFLDESLDDEDLMVCIKKSKPLWKDPWLIAGAIALIGLVALINYGHEHDCPGTAQGLFLWCEKR